MNVPHFFQSSEQTCGAACLRMLCAALGTSFDEATIAQACRITPVGCTVHDLIQGAQTLGLNAELLAILSEPDAIHFLSDQTPFVAMIDLASVLQTAPMFQWHFVVPLGRAGDEVTYHDPLEGPDRRARLDDFLGAWATAGYRGVRVWIP